MTEILRAVKGIFLRAVKGIYGNFTGRNRNFVDRKGNSTGRTGDFTAILRAVKEFSRGFWDVFGSESRIANPFSGCFGANRESRIHFQGVLERIANRESIFKAFLSESPIANPFSGIYDFTQSPPRC